VLRTGLQTLPIPFIKESKDKLIKAMYYLLKREINLEGFKGAKDNCLLFAHC
jgi:hypothetical protein